MVLEKTLESPLDCKEIQPVHSEGDQPWDFFGTNDAKAETPVLWPPHAKSWLTGKDSGAGRDWEQEEKRMTEDEMAGWHHWLDRRESEWTPGVGDGQGGPACCDSWGCKESDMIVWLNWTELISTAERNCSTQGYTPTPSGEPHRPVAEKDWGMEENGELGDKMVGCHHWPNGLEFEQTPGNSEGQGSRVQQFMGLQRVGHNSATE